MPEELTGNCVLVTLNNLVIIVRLEADCEYLGPKNLKTFRDTYLIVECV